mgnify:CR=1 FL=1
MKTMHLCVETNSVDSLCKVDLGVTKAEWDKMEESEQLGLINEFRANVMNEWVEELDEEHHTP